MSLKGFHVVFILASLGLSLFMGLWAGQAWLGPAGGAGWAGFCLSMFVLAGAIFVYLIAFLRKFRGVSSM